MIQRINSREFAREWRLRVKSQALKQFLGAVAADPVLQGQCAVVGSLAELVQLGQDAGFAITARELQLWAHDEAFGEPWWPWASAGKGQRQAFFRG
jgi:predicted ribosomally synthesized peptide with nif11-like leader